MADGAFGLPYFVGEWNGVACCHESIQRWLGWVTLADKNQLPAAKERPRRSGDSIILDK